MLIDRFSKSEFESALPADLWASRGISGREFVYAVPVLGSRLNDGELEIRIHSSVNVHSNVADGTGKNSIRIYLFSPKFDVSLGKAYGKYITRIPGWQWRMLEQLRKLYGRGQESRRCACGELSAVYTAKTAKNKGRKFYKCIACGEWGGWV